MGVYLLVFDCASTARNDAVMTRARASNALCACNMVVRVR